MIQLSTQTPFSSGGNRFCYVHPENSKRCLKILNPDRSPTIRRREKSFPSNLRSLESFDENITEAKVLKYIHETFSKQIIKHVPQTYGIQETDLGFAHETDLIRDDDNDISRTVEQHIWAHGKDDSLNSALTTFFENWTQQKCPRTRDLIPHNLVLQKQGNTATIIVIDGLGRNSLLGALLEKFDHPRHFEQRKKDLLSRIQKIQKKISAGEAPGFRIKNLIRS